MWELEASIDFVYACKVHIDFSCLWECCNAQEICCGQAWADNDWIFMSGFICPLNRIRTLRVLKLKGLKTVFLLTPTPGHPCKSRITKHCMHTITPKTHRGMRLEVLHESKQTSLTLPGGQPPLSDGATFHRQWHMKYLFLGSIPRRKNICIPTPATSFCIST